MRNLAHRMLPASEPFYPFPIDYAAKFDGASKLSRSRALTTSTTADDRKKQTVNVSVKRAKLGAYQGIIASYYGGSDYCWLYFETNDTLAVVSYAGGGLIANIATTAVYRDVSQHYNIHLELDATQATASDRVKLWVNGAPVALTGTFPPLNSVDMNTIFQGFDWNIGSSVVPVDVCSANTVLPKERTNPKASTAIISFLKRNIYFLLKNRK